MMKLCDQILCVCPETGNEKVCNATATWRLRRDRSQVVCERCKIEIEREVPEEKYETLYAPAPNNSEYP